MVSGRIDQEAGLDTDMAPDRRRPARQNDVNPALIPLLRGEVSDDFSDFEDRELSDPIAAARGIISAIPIAILLWTLIGFGSWALL